MQKLPPLPDEAVKAALAHFLCLVWGHRVLAGYALATRHLSAVVVVPSETKEQEMKISVRSHGVHSRAEPADTKSGNTVSKSQRQRWTMMICNKGNHITPNATNTKPQDLSRLLCPMEERGSIRTRSCSSQSQSVSGAEPIFGRPSRSLMSETVVPSAASSAPPKSAEHQSLRFFPLL